LHQRRTISSRSARLEAVTLAAYHDALVCLSGNGDPQALIAQLGDVDRQASHPATSTRLVLAGRLIAAAQLAGPQPLPESEVHAFVRSWLAERGAALDDAAPSTERRVAPEDERVSGLDRSLLDCDRHGGLSRVAWTIAALILQHLIRPPMEIGRTLAIRGSLESLAAKALDALCDSSPFGLANDELNELLAHTAVQVRAASRTLRSGDVAWERRTQDDWVHIAAGSVGAYAAWAGVSAERAMRDAVARATERLSASLVPDEPERFSREAALEHAVHTAFDAAATALGLSAHPTDPVLVEIKPDILDSLLEATSSGLIGAWVVDRVAP
jgi:hypothetical protein